MSNVFKSMKLDYYVLKGNYKIFLVLAYVIATVIGALTKFTYLMGMIVMIISAASSSTYFSVYEKNHLSRLYGMLPLKRSEAIAGRYIYTVLFGLANGVVSGTIAYILSTALNKDMDPLVFSAAMSFGFLYFCLFFGIQFPVFLRFGFSRAYMFASLPMYLIFVGVLLLSRNFNNVNQTVRYFTDNPAMVWVTGIGAGLVLACISYFISSAVSKRHEL